MTTLTLLLASIMLSPALLAREFVAGDLSIDHPHAPATPPGVGNAAGYFGISNRGERDERLLGGEVAFARRLELHRTTVENDVARMREIDALVIPAGERVEFAHGGLHLMFVGLEEPLVEGERFTATLRFEQAGEVDIEFVVTRPGAGGHTMNHGGSDHDSTNHDEVDHDEMDHDGIDPDGIDPDGTDHGEASHDGMSHDRKHDRM